MIMIFKFVHFNNYLCNLLLQLAETNLRVLSTPKKKGDRRGYFFSCSSSNELVTVRTLTASKSRSNELYSDSADHS